MARSGRRDAVARRVRRAATSPPVQSASAATASAGAPPATSTAPTATPSATSQPAATAKTSATPGGVPAGVAMPNASFTPGEPFAGVTAAQVCRSGYASGVRHVESSQYHEVYAEYGIPYPEPSGTYELDHLIPLELGGDNANANLWPEPASPTPGFHQKDNLENTMHGLVCSGRLDLHEAQQEIATNWYAAYVRYVGG
jgi:hypothetical protein